MGNKLVIAGALVAVQYCETLNIRHLDISPYIYIAPSLLVLQTTIMPRRACVSEVYGSVCVCVCVCLCVY